MSPLDKCPRSYAQRVSKGQIWKAYSWPGPRTSVWADGKMSIIGLD